MWNSKEIKAIRIRRSNMEYPRNQCRPKATKEYNIKRVYRQSCDIASVENRMQCEKINIFV